MIRCNYSSLDDLVISKKQVNILDILDTMVASNAEASVAANGLRDNIIACAGGEESTKDENDEIQNTKTATTVVPDMDDYNDTIKARRKRSGNDLTACCKELGLSLPYPYVQDIHREWARNKYFLQTDMSDVDRLVYKANVAWDFQTPRHRYLYIRRQSDNRSI